MLKDSDILFEVLQKLGATKPYLKYAGLSKSGEKAYRKLINVIYSLETMGFDINANQIIDELDKFTTEGDFNSN
ncbi:MAG TPA: hypothetical protein PLG05_06020 [Bacteroidales bacterium]|nr:hypothetical protein [Bacteroidales bacterium]HOR59729.1 hypothetical protein [Bacteroidales bacterium]HPL04714.1 hypothetical protein [Bacteroidales bacterium]